MTFLSVNIEVILTLVTLNLIQKVPFEMGCGGTGGALPGLLPLDLKNTEYSDVFCSGDLDEEYEVERDPIAR